MRRPPTSPWRPGRWALALALSGLGACASAPAAPESGGGLAERKPVSLEPCREYAKRLCESLGERSEGCAAAASTAGVMAPAACQAGLDDFDTTLERIASLRQACDAVVARVCSDFGEDSSSCRAVRADLPQVPPGHCPVLLREYPALRAGLERREALERPVEGERWSSITGAGAPSFGPADASVVVVAFSDFQCPFCARAARTVEQIRQRYGTRVRFVFRHYPLSFHDNAHVASRAAQAAHVQGKFWAFHDLLFAHQDALEREDLRRYAEEAGLDLKAFDAALDAEETRGMVDADIALGDSVQVRGTPTMLINGKRVENPLEFESVAELLDAALAE